MLLSSSSMLLVLLNITAFNTSRLNFNKSLLKLQATKLFHKGYFLLYVFLHSCPHR